MRHHQEVWVRLTLHESRNCVLERHPAKFLHLTRLDERIQVDVANSGRRQMIQSLRRLGSRAFHRALHPFAPQTLRTYKSSTRSRVAETPTLRIGLHALGSRSRPR